MNRPRIFEYDAVVVGACPEGYACALNIKYGGRSVAVICEDMDSTRSAKPVFEDTSYCRKATGQDGCDNIHELAQKLFSCGAVDGDNALCEAMLLQDCSDFLAKLDTNEADGNTNTESITKVLEEKVENADVPVFDKLVAIKVLVDKGTVLGLLCISKESGSLAVFRTPNVIFCVGAPLGVYADSLASDCFDCSSSLFLLAGAGMQNLTEWQYGLADKNTKDIISGALLESLPCFISVDEKGNEREFLLDYFGEEYEALRRLFAKGGEWQFDSAKVNGGTSVIDYLVYRECVTNKRRVFLDYTKNPFGIETVDFSIISDKGKEYTESFGTDFGTPIERLNALNGSAVGVYASRGIDLARDRIEISLCAVGCSGGASVNRWWQTSVIGLYAVGECAGTGGILHTGCKALNRRLAGALRASKHVCLTELREIESGTFYSVLQKQAGLEEAFCEMIVKESDNADTLLTSARRRFSDVFGAVRDIEKMQTAIEAIQNDIALIYSGVSVSHKAYVYKAYKMRDILYSQLTIACAMLDYAKRVKKSRGGAVYPEPDGNGGISGNDLRFTLDSSAMCRFIQEISLSDEGIKPFWRRARPLPDTTEYMDEIF